MWLFKRGKPNPQDIVPKSSITPTKNPVGVMVILQIAEIAD